MKNNTNTINSDLICGIFGLLVAGIFWHQTSSAISWMTTRFPTYLICILVLLSLSVLVKAWINPSRKVLFEAKDGNNGRIVITGMALLAWIAAMPWIGFYVTSVTIISFLVWYLAKARMEVSAKRMCTWVPIVAIKVGFFYYIFSKLLYVPLPKGIFF